MGGESWGRRKECQERRKGGGGRGGKEGWLARMSRGRREMMIHTGVGKEGMSTVLNIYQ